MWLSLLLLILLVIAIWLGVSSSTVRQTFNLGPGCPWTVGQIPSVAGGGAGGNGENVDEWTWPETVTFRPEVPATSQCPAGIASPDEGSQSFCPCLALIHSKILVNPAGLVNIFNTGINNFGSNQIYDVNDAASRGESVIFDPVANAWTVTVPTATSADVPGVFYDITAIITAGTWNIDKDLRVLPTLVILVKTSDAQGNKLCDYTIRHSTDSGGNNTF